MLCMGMILRVWYSYLLGRKSLDVVGSLQSKLIRMVQLARLKARLVVKGYAQVWTILIPFPPLLR